MAEMSLPNETFAKPSPVILALRQYPQGRDGRAHHTVIADLIRNPEGRQVGAGEQDNTNTAPSYWL